MGRPDRIPDGASQPWRLTYSLRAAEPSLIEAFERIAALARRLFHVPFAEVTLFSPSRPGMARSGAPPGGGPSRRHREAPILVSNAAQGQTLQRHAEAGRPRDIRFHASCGLRDEAGHGIGMLELVDRQPRTLLPHEVALLRELALMAELQVRAQASAATDELTGIPNRRGFLTLAEGMLFAFHPLGLPAALIALDLDGLKKINDALGHAAGSRALVRFAHCLLEVSRESDALGRIGGDEFCLLLADTDGAGAAAVLQRLRECVARSNAQTAAEPPIAFSAGIATRERGADIGLDQLLERADARLLEAKAARG